MNKVINLVKVITLKRFPLYKYPLYSCKTRNYGFLMIKKAFYGMVKLVSLCHEKFRKLTGRHYYY